MFPVTHKETTTEVVTKSIYVGSSRKSFLKTNKELYPTTELIMRTSKKGDKIKIEKFKTTNLFNSFTYKTKYKIKNLTRES